MTTSPIHRPPIHRPAARGLVVDPANRLLLMQFQTEDAGTLWLTPGGGIEPGESDEEALRRELWEEVGLESITVGPLVWTRRHIFSFAGDTYDADERYYLVPVSSDRLGPGCPQPYEADAKREWFGAEDLVSLPGPRAPTRLADFARSLLIDGPPSSPIAVGS